MGEDRLELELLTDEEASDLHAAYGLMCMAQSDPDDPRRTTQQLAEFGADWFVGMHPVLRPEYRKVVAHLAAELDS
jgi:hypothetical protein